MEPSHAPERLHAPETDFGDTLDRLIENDIDEAFRRFDQAVEHGSEEEAYRAIIRMSRFVEADPYRAAYSISRALDYTFHNRSLAELQEMSRSISKPFMAIYEGPDEPLREHYEEVVGGRGLYFWQDELREAS